MNRQTVILLTLGLILGMLIGTWLTASFTLTEVNVICHAVQGCK